MDEQTKRFKMIWCRALVEGEPLHEDPASGHPVHCRRFPMFIEAMLLIPHLKREETLPADSQPMAA